MAGINLLAWPCIGTFVGCHKVSGAIQALMALIGGILSLGLIVVLFNFELKIDSFNAADKLKVIKEVRAITGLGLKESKELVEKAPSFVKGGLTKEDAEKFKAVLEANGAKATIE